MMIVLGKISVNLFIHFGALVFLGTILLCYILAVSLHHVPAWLPMISDCALLAPEKYPFRWGFMVGSALLGVQSLLIYGADKPYSKSKLALFTGVVAAFCLSVVGVVNEEEDNIIHSGKLTRSVLVTGLHIQSCVFPCTSLFVVYYFFRFET